MMKRTVGMLATGLASAVGALLSFYLVGVHIAVSARGTAGSTLCNVSDTLNCDEAALSPLAEIAGVPIALIGLGFYVGMLAACALAFVWRESRDIPALPAAVALLAYLLAIIYSAVLAAYSVTQLDAVCPACAGLYVCNLVGGIGAWLWLAGGPGRAFRVVADAGFRGLLRSPVVTSLLAAMLVTVGVGTGRVDSAIEATAAAAGDTDVADGEGREGEGATEAIPIVDASADHAPALGPVDAPVTIVEFSDFQCPYCARFAPILSRVKEEFGDAVRLEFRHMPLPMHLHAENAALAAVCAHEQGLFWPYHDLLFENSDDLAGLTPVRLAEQLGADAERLQECMYEDATAEIVEADIQASRDFGVGGTPTFFVNGRRYDGGRPYEELREIVEGALADAEAIEGSSERSPSEPGPGSGAPAAGSGDAAAE